MNYQPSGHRYTNPSLYRQCGRAGLQLPRVSLGLWHNFGDDHQWANGRDLVLGAFDMGITHFDLANNYGPPAGSAEANFGRILKQDLSDYRDELLISTKAGYSMWPGPYGEWGSRKHVLSSLDQSLKRLGVEYVDIFYSHRFDPSTPLEETMGALAHAVRVGKALYVGLSNYTPEQTEAAVGILRSLGTPCLIHQVKYNMLDRAIEGGLTQVLRREGIGCIAFCPLAQGLLTNRYLDGIPADSRARSDSVFLKPTDITQEKIDVISKLDAIAKARGQSLAQMALAWVLRDPVVTSALIGASRRSQIEENLSALKSAPFSAAELAEIDRILRN